MKLVTVSQMLAIEKEANAAGMTYEQMMENAGRGLAECVQELEIDNEDLDVLGLVGPGNNGGDTLIALTLLAGAGWQVHAYLAKRDQDQLVDRVRKAGGQILELATDNDLSKLSAGISGCGVVLDGLLGTGTRPPLRGDVAALMAEVNRRLDNLDNPPYVVAVDCPSGMDCDTGEVPDECIPADLTVTMAAVKQGLISMPAYELAGDLRVVDIGLPSELRSLRDVVTEVAEEDLVANILPARPPLAHKGTFGTALIAAGSVNYTGAALLAGSAAYRAGAGLVTLAVPAPLHATLAGHLPEATWLLLPHELGVIARDAVEVLADALPSCNALLVGPGLGTEKTTEEFISRMLRLTIGATAPAGKIGFVGGGTAKGASRGGRLPPMVFDADALKLLARIDDWASLIQGTAVLTPHPGEMSVLTGVPTQEIQKDRRAVAARFARTWGHVVVLKGAFTVIAEPEGKSAIVPVATAALARAGTGDVLAGIIVGLRAQGVDPYGAAVAGAWIHAQAGLHAARRLGNAASVLAGDVLAAVADVISALPAG
jgi:NAD(P)H-hydrate epimerase